ncbi:MAG: DUF3332 domain-containing protein [Candidatus Cloacimonetes bacterium]|nr:DUF3332 domain-containing protein [Candidatus Cloacimonadota bacterium]
MKSCVKWIAMLLTVALFATSMLGCFGGFNLTRKVYIWNSQVGDKWVNTVVMWALAILPVYSFCGMADLLVLNAVEFWTGENPVSLADLEGEPCTISYNGHQYRVSADGNQIDIRQLDGDQAGVLTYDETTGAWSLQTNDREVKVAQIDQAGLSLYTPEGRSIAVTR